MYVRQSGQMLPGQRHRQQTTLKQPAVPQPPQQQHVTVFLQSITIPIDLLTFSNPSFCFPYQLPQPSASPTAAHQPQVPGYDATMIAVAPPSAKLSTNGGAPQCASWPTQSHYQPSFCITIAYQLPNGRTANGRAALVCKLRSTL